MNWYLAVLKKYADFSGRARRKEFWMFVLFNFIIAVVLGVVDSMIGVPVLGLIYTLGVLIPSVDFRRQDVGRRVRRVVAAVGEAEPQPGERGGEHEQHGHAGDRGDPRALLDATAPAGRGRALQLPVPAAGRRRRRRRGRDPA